MSMRSLLKLPFNRAHIVLTKEMNLQVTIIYGKKGFDLSLVEIQA